MDRATLGSNAPMHIPDGFLSAPVWAGLDVLAVPAVGIAARQARPAAHGSGAPLLGVLGAFVFAAQMINFPIAVGTSAHLLGGALLTCTIGPAAGMIVLTAVLVIQALVFQDGGLLALGANIVNLAVVGSLTSFVAWSLLGRRWRNGALFLSGLISVFCSGCCALVELTSSGVAVSSPLFNGALALFAVSGVIEGVITVAVVNAIGRINPAWVRAGESFRARWMLAVSAVVLSMFAFFLASTSPDSLEAIASRVGLAGRERQLFSAPMSDYNWQQLPVEALGRAAAGLIGLTLVYLAVVAVTRALKRSA